MPLTSSRRLACRRSMFWLLARWLRGGAAHAGLAHRLSAASFLSALARAAAKASWSASPELSKVAGRPELGLEEFNYLFSFDGTDEALAASKRYWHRLKLRTAEPVELPVTVPSIHGQVAAITTWTQGVDSAFSRLGEIKQLVLVVNGSN